MSMSAKRELDPGKREVKLPHNATTLANKEVLKNLLAQLEPEDNPRKSELVIVDGRLVILFKDVEAGKGAGTLQGDETA
jgi:hypothetical protein